jgi:arsenate reductase
MFDSLFREATMRKQTVLFLCTGNSARSQMAEALLRKHAGDRFEALSAGLDPVGINPLTIQVMNEIGIDVSGQRSKGVSEYLGKVAVHATIFVCDRAEASCPTIWPGALLRMSWPFEDPAACAGSEQERLDKFRQVRDQIETRVVSWLQELDAAP